ncbi:MAG: FAD-dependent oxidoreductase [Gammaproteobacteria bacterium]|nr:FAD-dependent oxidoreductase [Gammaproteobacteria bacterium]
MPALAETGIKRIVNGAISLAPDARPMIGPLPGVPDFYVACGFLGGIAQAGGIGLAMSQWMLNGEPEMDLSFIDVARFDDWTTREFARERTCEVFPRRYEIIYPQAERETGRGLRTTPIYEELLARGAVMGQAYGWERPLWFAPEGIAAQDEPSFKRPNWWPHVGGECRGVAQRVGLVEMSSYAKFLVEGDAARAFLDHVGSNRVPSTDGGMALSLMLNERGGIVGDFTVCRLAADCYYLVGATIDEGIYRRWLQDHAGDYNVEISVVTDRYAVLGITGPNSRALLRDSSSADFSTTAFPFMSMREIEIGPVACRALRVSYAGELGWELHCAMADEAALFDRLFSAGEQYGLRLIGSRALGNLRLEKGYRSWGAEMTTEVTPRAAGLERFCATDKNYIGSAALDAQRHSAPPRVLATLAVDCDRYLSDRFSAILIPTRSNI